MREHVLLFCLLGLVLTATIILVTASEAVIWVLSLIPDNPAQAPKLALRPP
jgi:hypothetical protein